MKKVLQDFSYMITKPVLTTLVAIFIVLSASVNYSGATLISTDSSFGDDTITYDTETGKKWLDITLSTSYSYNSVQPELEAGGIFEGYRLATRDDVLSFWDHAGINLDLLGSFNEQNFEPVTGLMALVGVTGVNTGNLGGGNYFDYTVGCIDELRREGWNYVASLGSDPDPTITGRASFGWVPVDNNNSRHGAWLIDTESAPVPIPGAIWLLGSGLIGLVGFRKKSKK